MTKDTNIFNVILNWIQNLYRCRNLPSRQAGFGMTRRDEFRVTRKSEIGQSLLEVMVALAVSTLVLTSLVSAVVVSVRNARFAKNQSLATKYAQEGIEKVRIYRDQNAWSDFDEPTCESVPLAALPSPLNRSIGCTPQVGGDRMEVTVTVSWTEAGRTHQSQLTTYLTEWE